MSKAALPPRQTAIVVGATFCDSLNDCHESWAASDRETMLIRVGCEVAFTFPRAAAMVLMLYLHPSRMPTVRKPERLESEPWLPVSEYTDLYGNHCGRVVAPAGRVLFRNDAIVDDCGLPDLQVANAPAARCPGFAA